MELSQDFLNLTCYTYLMIISYNLFGKYFLYKLFFSSSRRGVKEYSYSEIKAPRDSNCINKGVVN
jgi:hypothetical protein